VKIAVDLDDVCVEYFRSVVDEVNHEFGTDLDYEETLSWDDNPLKRLDVFGEGRDWWTWMESRCHLWSRFPAVAGAVEGIDALKARGHYVECLTSKPEWARWVVWDWLALHQPDFDSVTICPTGVPKHSLSHAGVLIDDAPHNVEAWTAKGRWAILFDRPWNRSIRPLDLTNCVRARGWNEVIEAVDAIEATVTR
jgi:5'(3')-deoxyribonucleotidase